MSLGIMPQKLLFNSLAADTVSVAGGILTIKGLPPIELDAVSSCYKLCPAACTPQVITLTPTVPGTPCECPYEWEMKLMRKVCFHGRTDNDVIHERFYSFSSPTGSTPTVAEIVDNLVDEINKDPYSFVTAAKIGVAPNYTAMTLTEKNCDSEPRTCGIEVAYSSGTIVNTTAHVSATLTSDDQLRAWPIQPGSFGERPNSALCGVYCVYLIELDPLGETRDQNFDNAWVKRKGAYELWVNSSLANYAADWETEMAATGLPCFA